MAYAIPPSRWQSEDFGSPWLQNQQEKLMQNGHAGVPVPQAAEVSTVNNAWKHVKAVVTTDSTSADLYDLLTQSGKETIDPMPPGVPDTA